MDNQNGLFPIFNLKILQRIVANADEIDGIFLSNIYICVMLGKSTMCTKWLIDRFGPCEIDGIMYCALNMLAHEHIRHLSRYDSYDIMEAGRYGCLNLLKYLCKKTYHWNIALQGALIGGHQDIIEYSALQLGRNPNNPIPHKQQTLFLYACKYGNEKVVRYFIDNGISGLNKGLSKAGRYFRHNLIKLLIDAGATNAQKVLGKVILTKNFRENCVLDSVRLKMHCESIDAELTIENLKN